MSAKSNKGTDIPLGSWIRDSNLFHRFEEVKQAIEEHKWYESEKAGYDIGWDRAAVDWRMRFSDAFRDAKE